MSRFALFGLMMFSISRAAYAAPPACASLSNPIYVQADDTQTELVTRMGRALRDNTNNPITLVYVTSNSCANVQAFEASTPITSNLSFVPSTAESPNWTPASTSNSCTPPVGGVVPDVVSTSIFRSTCTSQALPSTVHSTQGPIEPYLIVVPQMSLQTAITYEEAYFVFGFGEGGMVTPWEDESEIFIRPASSSVMLSWAANIGVPVNKWKGTPSSNSSALIASLQSAAVAEKAVGIIDTATYESNRSVLNALAFRTLGQYAAYYPDSTSGLTDKQNVRDGHYTVWSPTFWFDRIDGGGVPVSANARYFVDLVAGNTVAPEANFSVIDIIAAVRLIPDCAMNVSRVTEGGPLSLYAPTQSCGCKYDSIVGISSCQTCSASCSSGVCRDGFCEVR